MKIIDLSWRNFNSIHILSFLEKVEYKNQVISLDLKGNFLNMFHLKKLFKLIKQRFPSLNHLDLSMTNLSTREFQIICSEIKDLQDLNSLHLINNNIKKGSISFLKPIVPNLIELNLSYNLLKPQGVYILASFFPIMKSLEKLFLEKCQFQSHDFFSLAEKISSLQNLKYFSVDGNYCSDTIFSYFLFELPKKKLKSLNLGNICHYDENSNLFFHQLQFTSFLSSQLELCENLEILTWNMYYDFHILQGIEKLNFLKKLTLLFNPFYGKPKISFFPYLKNLEYLKVSSIDSKSLEFILLVLPKTMDTLSLQYISFLNSGFFPIFDIVIKSLSRLKYFECSNSSINNYSLKNICKTLPYCKNLTSISLANNLIDDSGVLYLSFLLHDLKLLKFLNIVGNLITNIGFKRILQILCFKKEKIHLEVDNNFIFPRDYFFKEYISFFYKLQERMKKSYQWTEKEKEIYLFLKLFHPFFHRIPNMKLQNKDLYNHTLFQLKKEFNETKNYFLFNSFMEKTKDYHPFFYQIEFQYLIKEYL